METFVYLILAVGSTAFIKQHRIKKQAQDLAKDFLTEYHARFYPEHVPTSDDYFVVIEAVISRKSNIGSTKDVTELVFQQNDQIRHSNPFDVIPLKFHQLVTVAIWAIIEGNTLTGYLKDTRPQDVPNWGISPRNKQRVGEAVLDVIPPNL